MKRNSLIEKIAEIEAFNYSNDNYKLQKVIVMGLIGIAELTDAELIDRYKELTEKTVIITK